MWQLLADIAVLHREHPVTMAAGWAVVGLIVWVGFALFRR
jgi:hypothetical protein